MSEESRPLANGNSKPKVRTVVPQGMAFNRLMPKLRKKQTTSEANRYQVTVIWKRISTFSIAVGVVVFIQAMLTGNIRDPFGIIPGAFLVSLTLALVASVSVSITVIVFMKYLAYRRNEPKNIAALARKLTSEYFKEIQTRQSDSAEAQS